MMVSNFSTRPLSHRFDKAARCWKVPTERRHLNMTLQKILEYRKCLRAILRSADFKELRNFHLNQTFPSKKERDCLDI